MFNSNICCNVASALWSFYRVIKSLVGLKRFGDIFHLCPSTFVAQNISNILSPTLQCCTVYSMVNFNEIIKRSKYTLSLTAVFKCVSFVFFVNREQPVEPQVKLRKRRFNFRQKDRQKCTLM